MSLKIFSSSRISDLAGKLKERLLQARQGADPFEFTKIVVPNGNVASWLQIRQFASEPSLCAGLEFPFLEKRLFELLKEGLPAEERSDVELLPDHSYARAIVSILMASAAEQPEYAKLAPFRAYVGEGGSDADGLAIADEKQAAMTWQLADKLADLMDAYEVHRPEIVASWLNPGTGSDNLPKGEVAEAEAALARALWGNDGRFPLSGTRLSLRQLYERVKDAAPEVSEQTVYLFGLSTLSLLQTEILGWLSRAHKVEVFLLNPCREYWGDISATKTDDKAVEEASDHALLQDLGRAGRETVELLADLDAANGTDTLDVEDANPKTVLAKVQESIRGRTTEIAGGRCLQDASVQVIGTPGLEREVQMVYNSILGSVVRPAGVTGERPWPDCSFSDIAVIVPDMQTYRPVIEAVFDARGEVPYAVLDTSARDDSQYLRGFLSLVELGRKGLNRARLFDVLENPCVQRALDFTREDVVSWRELTEKIGAFDGFEHDDAQGYFDWSSALRRLRLARIADQMTEGGDDVPLVKDGGDASLKFSEVVELLYRDLTDTLYDGEGRVRTLPLVAPREEDGSRADCWADRLSRLAKAYLELDQDDRLEKQVQQSLVGTLYSLGEIPRPQGFEIAVAAVDHFVGGLACRKGKYLTSGVTIGGFASLSALPFKQVYIMGMGAGGFPGRTSSSTLDVRGASQRLGDILAPNRNRFFFLSALMSAQDRLVLSYPNRDLEKDAELFPAGLVCEVKKFIGENVLRYADGTKPEDRKFREFKGYPLLERGEADVLCAGGKRPTDDIVWSKDDPQAGLLPTYSVAARRLAQARNEGKGKLPEVERSESRARPLIEISAKDLSEFLKNPVLAVIHARFGVGEARYVETGLDPDRPLGSLSGPDLWTLQAKWLLPDAKDAVPREIVRLQRAGKLPTGILGDLAEKEILNEIGAKLPQVQAFVADFALSDGERNTLRLTDTMTLNEGSPEEQKVRLVAEVSNWRLSGDEISVLVTKYLGKNQNDGPSLPPDSCLQAFVAYLMCLRAGTATANRLKVGVADLTNGTIGAWSWAGIGVREARDYLETLIRSYLTYERTAQGGVMVDFTYKKLLSSLSSAGQPPDWDEILEKLTAEEYNRSGKSFNNDLLLEQNLAPYRRDPTAAELAAIYDERYRLPLSGVRANAAKEEADHE